MIDLFLRKEISPIRSILVYIGLFDPFWFASVHLRLIRYTLLYFDPFWSIQSIWSILPFSYWAEAKSVGTFYFFGIDPVNPLEIPLALHFSSTLNLANPRSLSKASVGAANYSTSDVATQRWLFKRLIWVHPCESQVLEFNREDNTIILHL